jgi:predicted DNA-binding transcriptional regulator AlpA
MSKFPLTNSPERSIGVVAADNAVLANRKISVQEAAAYLGISKSFLDKTRLNGTGPVYLKIGRRVAYDLGDLEIWVTGQKRRHTSEIARLPGAVQP